MFASGILGAPVSDDTVKAAKAAAPSIEVVQVEGSKREEEAVIDEAYVRSQFSDAPILADIAFCESTWRHYNKHGKVLRGIKNSYDVGLMQINELYHLEKAVELGYDIHTPEGNIAFAKYLYGKYGTKPWKASKACWDKEIAMR